MSFEVSSDLCKKLFESHPDSVLVLSEQGVVLAANPASSLMFCRQDQDLCNYPLDRLFSTAGAEPFKQLINEHSPYGEVQWMQSCIRADGSHFLAEVRTVPHRADDGELFFIAVISERIKLEDVLLAQDSPSELLARTIALEKVGGWEVNLSTMKLSWTRETFRITEIDPPNEPPLVQGINLFAPEARPTIAAAVQAAIESGKPYDLELPLITAKGRKIWVRTQGYGEVVNGAVRRIYGTFKDITEQKSTELALRESEERWRFAIEGSGDSVWDWDWDLISNQLRYSQLWLDMLGYQPSEIGSSITDWQMLAHPEDMARMLARAQAHINRETAHFSCEYRLKCKDGSWKWILARGLVVERDANGSALRLIGTNTDISSRKKSQAALHNYELVVTSISQGVIVTGTDGLIVSANKAFCDITGFTETEILGRDCKFLVGPLTDPATTRLIRNALTQAAPFAGEIQNHRKDGAPFWNELTITPAFDEQGMLTHFIGVTRDVTRRKEADLELRIAAATFSAQEGIIITDDQKRILRVNEAFEKISGYNQNEVLGQNPSMFSSGTHDKNFYKKMWTTIDETGLWHGEVWDRRKNGEIFPQSVTISVVRNADDRPVNYIGTFIDISNIKHAEAAISKLSYYDTLTGLINRNRLKLVLESAITAHCENKQFGGLLIASLDNFKAMNGALGQDAGDSLLIEISRRLTKSIKSDDVVSRYGGDEFVLILNNLGTTHEQASQALLVIAQTILSCVEDDYEFGNGRYYSTSSVGATLFGKLGTNITSLELIKQLEIALFNAKQEGRNRVSFFDPDLQKVVNDRVKLLSDLRKGILQHEFEMFYQAQLDKVGNIVGTEALVRWNHPQRGLLSPAEFIPLAETNGLMVKLGDEIMLMCFAQLRIWQETRATRHLKLSINITADQFYEVGFAADLEALIAKYNLDTSGIMLEFTESMLLDDIDLARDTIAHLSALGVSFAIDDFGTGYSSLAYLSQLSMDQLKIDQSFVRNIGKSDKDAAIVRTIIDMAKTLDMNVVAEGVETAAQRKYLLQHGCQYFQGYLFSRPLPLAEFNALVISSQ